MSCRFLLQPRHVDVVLYVDFYGISTVNNRSSRCCHFSRGLLWVMTMPDRGSLPELVPSWTKPLLLASAVVTWCWGSTDALFSAVSDVKTLAFPLASNMFVGKGCWSIFIGFWALELSNLILPDSMADCSCCLNTLHSLVSCEVALCHQKMCWCKIDLQTQRANTRFKR